MPSVIAVLFAALLFGTTGTSQALGPEGTTPFSVGIARLLIGGTVLALVTFGIAASLRRKKVLAAPPHFALRPAALMALTGISLFVYQPLFFLGTSTNGVAVGTVVALGSAPILAGMLEWALTRRRPTSVWMSATGLATLGVLLLGFGGGASGGTDLLGLLGSIGAGASFAVIANAQRQLLNSGWDPFTVVGSMGAGSAVLSVCALAFVDLSWMATAQGLVMALWLGLATLAAAYALFTWGLNGLTAATAATLTLGEPLTASILGLVVLGERLSLTAIAGLTVLALGLALLAWGSRAGRDPKPYAVEG